MRVDCPGCKWARTYADPYQAHEGAARHRARTNHPPALLYAGAPHIQVLDVSA